MPKPISKDETSRDRIGKTKRPGKGPKSKGRMIGTCFVLMPFKEPFDTYFTSIIKPAVIAAKLEPLRGDSLFTPTPIMGDIWEMIQAAKVLLAELTGKNANVFYELGLGHAIGKPIVLISETMEDVPFDLQPLRVINYNKDDPAWGNKVRTKITLSLKETLQSPVNAVPPMFRKVVKSQAPAESELSVRLADLERRVASLVESGIGEDFISIKASRDPFGELNRRLSRLRSLEHAVQITAEALRSGLPREMVMEALRGNISREEAKRVFSLASRIAL